MIRNSVDKPLTHLHLTGFCYDDSPRIVAIDQKQKRSALRTERLIFQDSNFSGPPDGIEGFLQSLQFLVDLLLFPLPVKSECALMNYAQELKRDN